MKYTVVWKSSAEEELASLWMAAENRAAISVAANTIDQALRFDPNSVGESRRDSARILIVPPLVVTFDVLDDDRLVTILWVGTLRLPR